MKRFLLGVLFAVLLLGTASAQTGAVRLEGQVVCCADCWAEADRTKVEYGTAEELLKAASCVAGGDPTLIAVREGEKFTLYQLEQGKFRLPGKDWLEFVGRRVALTGAVRQKKDARVVRVDALEVVSASRAERDAANVVGSAVELTLKDLSGAEQRLGALKGRIVVLNFWATYCVPCRREMPDLAAIQNEYAALGVQVVGASTDAVEDRAKVLQFVKETKVNFPVWTGAGVADMMRFGLGAALPGTVVVGRDGRVAKVISGVVNPAELKKQIDAMLAAVEQTAAGGRGEARRGKSASEKPDEVSTVPS
ncbi:MAG TPA: TlpA disulfide reductase family protein [Pyrinomonadaceae bacterium]|jgi:thiol-disulfide isomerase/thioredoxin|nr:TlpA disulfide reductase family protein [Pyrinomonadaceae bacterium]